MKKILFSLVFVLATVSFLVYCDGGSSGDDGGGDTFLGSCTE